jgi:CBS domain-containing protein
LPIGQVQEGTVDAPSFLPRALLEYKMQDGVGHLVGQRWSYSKRQYHCRFTAVEGRKIRLTIGIMYTNLVTIHCPLIPAADLKELAMKVGDILRKKTARISTIRMNETVGIAAQLMRASNVSALVVKDVVRTEGNTAVGMFTERDVVRAIAEHGAAGVNMKVSQLISVQQLVSCSSHDTLEDVRHLMNRHHIRHLPVIDDHSLCGVISIRDISTAFDEEAMATVFAASA